MTEIQRKKDLPRRRRRRRDGRRRQNRTWRRQRHDGRRRKFGGFCVFDSSFQSFFTPRQRRQKLDGQILNSLVRVPKTWYVLIPLQVYRSPCRKWQVHLRGRSLKEWLWNPENLKTKQNKIKANKKIKILKLNLSPKGGLFGCFLLLKNKENNRENNMKVIIIVLWNCGLNHMICNVQSSSGFRSSLCASPLF